jgi:hypothetical protein
MLEVRIDVAHARTIHRLVQEAAAAARRTPETQQRGLGGFDAAWREYVQYLERNCEVQVNDSMP